MEPSIYSYSLCIALPLMLFFGFYFLLAQTPEKAIFENYLRSRRIMGMALLLLAANYSVHFFFGIRFKNVHAAILMNLSTYFLCYYLFSSALITLLDRFYIHTEKDSDAYHSMDHLLRTFRGCPVVVSGWNSAEKHFAGFGSMAGGLRTGVVSQSHCRIPQGCPDFR